jgi:hypothetical protein
LEFICEHTTCKRIEIKTNSIQILNLKKVVNDSIPKFSPKFTPQITRTSPSIYSRSQKKKKNGRRESFVQKNKISIQNQTKMADTLIFISLPLSVSFVNQMAPFPLVKFTKLCLSLSLSFVSKSNRAEAFKSIRKKKEMVPLFEERGGSSAAARADGGGV